MQMSMAEIWAHMGWFARGIMFLLIGMSILTMTNGIRRWFLIRGARKETARFAPLFTDALNRQDFEEAERLVEEHPKSHLAQTYRRVFSNLKVQLADGSLSAIEVASTQRTIEMNKIEQISKFRHGMGVLATVGSTAPFVGLLGTTMGVVNAFTGMATAGSAGMAAISAGIAEALIATAVGLGAAIPAVWLFNYFVNRVEQLGLEMEYGTAEFIDFLEQVEARAVKVPGVNR